MPWVQTQPRAAVFSFLGKADVLGAVELFVLALFSYVPCLLTMCNHSPLYFEVWVLYLVNTTTKVISALVSWLLLLSTFSCLALYNTCQ